jgi:hypothetical protein
MIYVQRVTTPANTAEASPLVTPLELDYGIVHRVEISFPPGAAGLLHLQIRYALHQVWPSNPGGSFAWDSDSYEFDEFYPLETVRPVLDLVTWNLDDTYAHDVDVRLGLLPREAIQPERAEVGLLQELTRRLLGRRAGGA